jgi:hypothetical protein
MAEIEKTANTAVGMDADKVAELAKSQHEELN